jgi:hypothetical protein
MNGLRREESRDARREAPTLEEGEFRQFRAFRGKSTRKLETYTSGTVWGVLELGSWVETDRRNQRKIIKNKRDKRQRPGPHQLTEMKASNKGNGRKIEGLDSRKIEVGRDLDSVV